MALKVGELFASFNIDTSGIDRAVGSAERSLSNIGSGLTNAGSTMTNTVTRPIMDAAKQIYEAGSSFDAQMSRVFAIGQMEDSAEDMDAVRHAAILMGSTTSFTATEAGQALEYMALAGWDADEMIAGLPAIMDLAAASGEDLGATSDIVTDALTAFGLSAQDATHFADVLATTSANSNTTVGMLGEAFKYVAPLAGSLGYSVEDVTAALGLMANSGIKSTMAGTSLRNIILALQKPTEDQADAMEMLGLSFFNADGTVKSFGEIMRDLRAAGSGYDFQEIARQVAELDSQLELGVISEEEYDAAVSNLVDGSDEFLWAISTLGGKRGLSGLLAIMNASDDDFNQLTGAIANADGSSRQMAATMLDNAKGAVTLFKSALEGLEITLWELVEGPFRSIVDRATGWVQAFQGMDSATQKGTLRIAALAAAIGPAMVAIGKLLPMLPKLTHLLQALASPMGMLGLGLIAIGAAAIDVDNTMGRTLEKALPEVGKKVADLGKKAKRSATQLNANVGRFLGSLNTAIATGLPDLMDGIGDLLTVLIETLGNSLPMVGEVVRTLVQTLASGLSRNMPQLVPAVVNLMKNLALEIIRNAPVVLSSMAEIATSLLSSLADIDWSQIGNELGNALREAFEQIGTLLKQLAMGDEYVEDASWEQVGIALVHNIMEGIATAVGGLRDFLGSLILGDDYNPDASWAETGGAIIDKIFDGADGAMDAGASFVEGIIDAIAELFSTANISAASESLRGIIERILTRTADLIGLMGTFAADILTAIGNALFGTDENGESVVSAGVKSLTGILETIFTTISTKIIPTLGGAVSDILGAIAGLFTEENGKALGDSLAGLGTTIVKGVVDAIVALVDAVAGVTDSLDVSGVQTTMAGIFDTLAQAAIDALAYAIPRLGDAAVKLLDAFGKLFSPENIQRAFDGANQIVGTLADGATGEGGLIGTLLGAVATIIEKIGSLLSKENIGAIIGGVRTLITNLLSRITDVIEGGEVTDFIGRVISAIGGALSSVSANAGEILDGAVDIATGIIDAIAAGIRQLPSIANQLVAALIDVLRNMADSLRNSDGEAAGEQLGESLIGSVEALSDAAGEMADDNVLGRLGQAFADAIGAALKYGVDALGGLLTTLIDYIVTPEGLAAFFNLGVSLITLIINGIQSAIAGLWGSLSTMLANGIYELFDWLYDKLPDWGKNVMEFLGYTPGTRVYEGPRDMETIFGSKEATFSTIFASSDFFGENFAATGSWGMSPEQAAAMQYSTFLERVTQAWKRGDFPSFATEEDAMKAARMWYLTEIQGWVPPEVEIETPEIDATVTTDETAADEVSEAVRQTMEDLGVTAKETAEEAAAEADVNLGDVSVTGTVYGADATEGLETSLHEGKAPVADAAAEVSDAVVQAYLLKMNGENASAIAAAWIAGLADTMNADETAPAAATTLAQSVVTAAQNGLSSAKGVQIGVWFGQGIAAGIRSSIVFIISAVRAASSAALDMLRGELKIGSPSRLTAEIGGYFSEGFANGILDEVSTANDAALSLGAGAADALSEAYTELAGEASNGLSLPTRGDAEAEARTQETRAQAEQTAAAIANALNGALVVMDGETTGHLLVPYISEEIAVGAAGRRNGAE